METLNKTDKEELAIIVGLLVKELRTEKGITQEEMGHLLHLSKVRICQIESGAFEPSISTVTKICKVMNEDPFIFALKGLRKIDWSECRKNSLLGFLSSN